ncbi:MAG: preprotein translocase subunit SecE [Deltaproteobacteria bacterium]|jgi:preprotein translocase subunit SecE|nr:preprotein translocase subunit SecE [Deltaproteobacteria bacterium]
MTKHRKSKADIVEITVEDAADKLDKPVAPAIPRLKSKREEAEVKPPNSLTRILTFFKEAKKELTRVTWPTRDETLKSTGVLLVLVAISAAYLGLVDGFLSWVLRLLVG